MPKGAELPATCPGQYRAAIPDISLEVHTLPLEVQEGPQSQIKETLVWPTAQRKQRLIPRKKK